MISAIQSTHMLTTKRAVEFDEKLSQAKIYGLLVSHGYVTFCITMCLLLLHLRQVPQADCFTDNAPIRPSRDVITFFRQINTDFVNYTFSNLFASLYIFLEQPSGTFIPTDFRTPNR